MTPPPRDDASSYADGHPDAVRRARPPEPSEAAWEEMRLRIHARVAKPAAVASAPAPARRWGRWVAAAAALTTTAAAVAALLLLSKSPAPRSAETPEVVKNKPVAPPVDPLAEWDVLPMAAAEEVVLQRVPGDGWLPVGAHPFDGELTLATAAEVELDENPEWPTVMVPSPKHAPMIFATKPR